MHSQWALCSGGHIVRAEAVQQCGRPVQHVSKAQQQWDSDGMLTRHATANKFAMRVLENILI